MLLNTGLPEHKPTHCSSQAGLAWVPTGTIDILVDSVVCSHRTNQETQSREQTQPQLGHGQTDRLLCSVGPCRELEETVRAWQPSRLPQQPSAGQNSSTAPQSNLLTMASSYLLLPSQMYGHVQSNTAEVIIHPHHLPVQF